MKNCFFGSTTTSEASLASSGVASAMHRLIVPGASRTGQHTPVVRWKKSACKLERPSFHVELYRDLFKPNSEATDRLKGTWAGADAPNCLACFDHNAIAIMTPNLAQNRGAAALARGPPALHHQPVAGTDPMGPNIWWQRNGGTASPLLIFQVCGRPPALHIKLDTQSQCVGLDEGDPDTSEAGWKH